MQFFAAATSSRLARAVHDGRDEEYSIRRNLTLFPQLIIAKYSHLRSKINRIVLLINQLITKKFVYNHCLCNFPKSFHVNLFLHSFLITHISGAIKIRIGLGTESVAEVSRRISHFASFSLGRGTRATFIYLIELAVASALL